MRLPRASPEAFILAGLSVGALFLALQIATTTLSDSSRDVGTALQWRGGSPAALAWAAEDAFITASSADDFRRAQELATRSLLGSPLKAEALRVVGLAADQDGEADRARAILTEVARLQPRDLRAQAWLFQDRLRAGDYAAALAHLDAILRVRPHLLNDIMPVLASFAADPSAFPALADYLAGNPPWRRSFLARLPAEATDAVALNPFYALLQTGPSPPEDGELAAYLDRLIAVGEVDRAYLAWVGSLPADRRDRISALYNGHFDYPPSGLPFDWRLSPVKGADAGIARTGDGGENALRVRFFNTRVPFQHVVHLLTLAPGNYRVQGQVRADDLQTPRGLQWAVSCGRSEVGASDLFAGSMPWTDFQFDVAIPATESCSAQELRLRVAWRVASEQQAAGEIWFDNLRIERLSPQ